MHVSYGQGAVPRGGGGVYVYREGGTRSGNVFPDFRDAYEAASRIEQGEVRLDPRLDSDLVIPADTYDMSLVRLVGDPRAISPTVTIASGAVFTGGSFYMANLAMQSLGATAPWTVGAGGLVMILDNASGFATGAGPMISLDAGSGALVMDVLRFCYLLSAGSAVISAVAGKSVDIYLYGPAAALYADTGSGAGAFTAHNMLDGVTDEGEIYIDPAAFP